MTNTELDVLIIGAGQAGLALGYYLKETPLRFQLVEQNARIGDSWRKRYDSLTLFTPRAYSALPVLALSGDPEGFATKDEIAEYFESYVNHFNLPVVTGMGIKLLEHHNYGEYRYRATTQDGSTIEAKAVVLATGGFQMPAIPSVASGLAQSVKQYTAENYQNPASIPSGKVLVVGDGATGRDIAGELNRAGNHQVILATGHPRKLLPKRFLGKSSWWWFDKLGLLRLSGETSLGRKIKKADAFPNNGKTLKKLQQQGVQVMPRLAEVRGHSVSFANGVSSEIEAVIWATGYRDNSAWVAIPEVKDAEGNFIHWQGISPEPGFYFIGRPWQRSRGSALITGVGADAEFLVEHIIRNILAEDEQAHAYAGSQDGIQRE